MKARLIVTDSGNYLEIHLPGPIKVRCLPVIVSGSRDNDPRHSWTWNGSLEEPTLRPSVKSWNGDAVCHTWITDAKAIFLEDSTHELAGKTLELLDIV